jgi:hypothetical protein
MLRCIGAIGGHIVGAGVEQTILQADARTAGSPAILQLVNCQFVTCAAMSLWGTGNGPGAEAGWQSFGDSGQPGFVCFPNDNRCSFVSVERCSIGFSVTCAHLLTPVVMTSGAGVSPITVTTAIPHGFSTGSAVGIVGVRGNEAANTGGSIRVLTPDRFEIEGTGNGAYAGGGTVVWTYMGGGKKANLSDQNNNGMKFDHCSVRGASVAAVFVGGENALAHELHACDLTGQVGVWMPAGGSLSMYGGTISASSWDFKYAGRNEHPINLFGTCTESASGLLSVEPLPHPLSGGALVFNAFGYDKKGGPAAQTNAVVHTSGRGVAPITVTTDAPHDLRTGQFVSISGVRGNDAANGTCAVQVLTSTTFTVAALGKGDYAGGGQVKSAGRLIDVNGPQCYVSLTGCSLAPWAAPGQLVIYCKDSSSRGPSSRIRLADCEIGADEFVMDSFVLIDEQSRWIGTPEGLPRETLLNGAQLVQNSAGHSFTPTYSQYKLGNLRGVRAIGGVGAKPGVNLANVAVLQGSRDGSHSTLAVAFPGGPEIDTNYAVVATPTTMTGTPAPNSWRIKSIVKKTTGFLITTEADPGFVGDVANSVTFDWHLIRWG